MKPHNILFIGILSSLFNSYYFYKKEEKEKLEKEKLEKEKLEKTDNMNSHIHFNFN